MRMELACPGFPGRYQRCFVDQRYADYTASDQAVWAGALVRNRALCGTHAKRFHPAYLEGTQALGLSSRIPRVEEISERLRPTGWRTICVDGYLPSGAYTELVSRRIFPVSRNIRNREHLDYAPAPDLVHDVLGHLPMLFCQEFRAYLERLARVMSLANANELDQEYFEAVKEVATQRSRVNSTAVASAEDRVHRVEQALREHASESTYLRRIYVWSVEFGLCGNFEDFTIHGAALLSAPTEFRQACNGAAPLLPYSIDVIEHENEFSNPLNRYFLASTFNDYARVLNDYEARMAVGAPRELESSLLTHERKTS